MISILLGLIAFILLNYNPDKYIFSLTETRLLSPPPFNLSTYYADLDSDGIEEHYYFVNGRDGNSLLLVYLFENFTKDQWNFRGQIDPYGCKYYLGNYDHDKFPELACLSKDSNRILLNLVEPFGANSHIVRDRLVDTISHAYLNADVHISDCQFHDLNGDHFDELVFSLHTGYAYQPRKVYAYDIRKDSLWSSPFAGSSLSELLIIDADQDGKTEILGESWSSGNYMNGGIAYPDTVSWFFVLDEKLLYKVPPMPTGGLFSRTKPFVLQKNSVDNLYLVTFGNLRKIRLCQMCQVNKDWTINKTDLIFPDSSRIPNDIILSADRKQVLFFDKDKSLLFSFRDLILFHFGKKLPLLLGAVPIFNPQSGIVDIQYIFRVQGRTDHFVFVNEIGKAVGNVVVEGTPGPYQICWAGLNDGEYRFVLSNCEADYTYSVGKNPWLYLRFLIMIVLIFGFYGFISLIRLIQAKQIARNESMRKEILELQLKSVRNQLDPHFTFNALNALSSLSLESDHKGVDLFIGYFSRLLRTHLNTSDQVIVPLRQEIEFVVNFAELQRIRFDNFFRLELEADPLVNMNRKIPKMLIQTHVENSIKHGMRPEFERLKAEQDHNEENPPKKYRRKRKPTDGYGRVWIKIMEKGDELSIIIEDNGCGRGNSMVPLSESTGTGLKAMDRIIASVRELYRMEIRQEFEDLKNEGGKSNGTRVRIGIR